MKRILQQCLFYLVMLSTGASLAYERTTHEQLAAIAADQSVLRGGIYGTALQDIGAPPYGATAYTASNGATNQTVEMLMMRGANAEDDGVRALAHFFNPQYNNFEGAPLTIWEESYISPIVLTGQNTSPDWAIEDRGERVIDRLIVPIPAISQDFSYYDAKRYFKLAMTGSSAAYRTSNLALVFESLGHVVHHIHDMAQPQHTRNDPHLPTIGWVSDWAYGGAGIQPPGATVYEGFTVAEYPSKAAMEQAVFNSPHIFYMQPPVFPTIRHYWHTPGATTDIRVGMAEFSSQNYLSPGTLFAASPLPFGPLELRSQSELYVPKPDGSNTRLEDRVVNVTYADGSTVSGTIEFIIGDVRDDHNGQVYANQELAAVSLLSRPSQLWPTQRVVSINRVVYKRMHEVLLPRAVRFSTGVINHFFRGRIGVERTPGMRGSWDIKNLSNETMSGTFSLYFEDDNGRRSRYGALSASLAARGGATIVAPEPPEATTEKVVVTFEGALGAEPNVPGGLAGARVVDFTPPPPPPIPCGNPLTASGSSEGLTAIYELGTTPGTVPVEFEAYYIPDGLTITANNAANTVFVDTGGLVSGRDNYPFYFDSNVHGTSQVRVNLTGNSDPGTLWWLVVGCPGESATVDPGDRPQPIRTVEWKFLKDGPSGVSCNFDFYVDGQYVTRVFGTARFFQNLSVGTHDLQYLNKSCSGIGSTDYSATYTDSAGEHFVTSPVFGSGDVFTVQ